MCHVTTFVENRVLSGNLIFTLMHNVSLPPMHLHLARAIELIVHPKISPNSFISLGIFLQKWHFAHHELPFLAKSVHWCKPCFMLKLHCLAVWCLDIGSVKKWWIWPMWRKMSLITWSIIDDLHLVTQQVWCNWLHQHLKHFMFDNFVFHSRSWEAGLCAIWWCRGCWWWRWCCWWWRCRGGG